MAGQLLEAGYEVTVSDLRTQALAPLEKKGARVAASPAEVADRAETVLICLPGPAEVRAVALGADGLVKGTTIQACVNFSTTGALAAREVADALGEKGIQALDCPVSGGIRGARAGTLTLMVSGPETLVDDLRPVLDVLGGKLFYLGAVPGLGQIAKLANNTIMAANVLAAAEALVLGAKAGLDAATLLDVINASTGRNAATEERFPKFVVPRTFNDGSRTALLHKDVSLAMREAEALGVPMWLGNAVRQFLTYAMTQGAAEDSPTALIRHIERWAGVEVGKRNED